MKTALVTGAAGFIGSHLTEALLNDGWVVRAFDILPDDDPANCLRFLPDPWRLDLQRIQGNVKNYVEVREAAKEADILFHLAAEVSIPYSYRHPDEVVETNVLGTLNVLRAAHDVGVGRVVHTSSSEVYGSAKYLQMDEKHPLQAQSPYAASKIAADKMAESFHRSYGLPVVTIRPFNVMGPRQSERAVIPAIIRQLLDGDKLEIGNTYPLRDFTYVTDTVQAFQFAATTYKVKGQEFNIGIGKCIDIGTLAGRIAMLMDKEIKDIRWMKERARPSSSEVDRLCADASKAHESLGWRPSLTLDDGLRETISWFRAHPEFHGNRKG